MAKILRARRDTSDTNNTWIFYEEEDAPKTTLIISAEAHRRRTFESRELARFVLPEMCDSEEKALAFYPKVVGDLDDHKLLHTDAKALAEGERDEARERHEAWRKDFSPKAAKAALDKEIDAVAAELTDAYAGDPAGAFSGGFKDDLKKGPPQLRDKHGKRIFARLFEGLPGRAVRHLGLTQRDLIAAVKAKVPEPEPPPMPPAEPNPLDEIIARRFARKEERRQMLLKRARGR